MLIKNIYNILNFREFCILFGIENSDNMEICDILNKIEINELNIIEELKRIDTLRFILGYGKINNEQLKNKLLKIYSSFSHKA